ncbi:MAG TPA: RsmE family RNA methyltransferase [Trueperaceae bacterium]
MRRHRIHLPRLESGISTVTGREAAHLSQVLRVSPGSEIRAFDGRGMEAPGVVRVVETGRVVVELGQPHPTDVEPELEIGVAVSLLKGDKLSDVVRQCTELGARGFRPLLASRRDVPELSANKLARLRRVAQEAAKQSGRAFVPQVHEPVPLGSLHWSGTAVVAHPGSQRRLADLELTGEATVITGPEGGFSDEEVASLEARGASVIGLGARVLRAETAPVALVAALLVPKAL